MQRCPVCGKTWRWDDERRQGPLCFHHFHDVPHRIDRVVAVGWSVALLITIVAWLTIGLLVWEGLGG